MDAKAIISFGIPGFIVSWVVIKLILRATASGRIISERLFHQTHNHPIPRIGGIALASAFVAVNFVALFTLNPQTFESREQWIIIGASLGMFGVGIWDDIHPLGAKLKLILQLVVAIAAFAGGIRIELVKDPLTGIVYQLGVWGVIPTVIWLVTLTNLVNLIDGLDGLAGGIALMLMCLLSYVDPSLATSYLAIGMAGALLGFLCFNFPPAKIYMGDGGAYFLGFLVGALSISNSQKGTVAAALIAPAFALALPIIDVALAIVRRGLKGLPIFRPDKKHIHHKLVESGYSRTRTVLTLYGLSLVFLVLAFGVFWSQGRLVPVLFGFMCVTLLVSARWLNFGWDWFAVGRVLGNSLDMRKETRYALALSNWFQIEAERSATLSSLLEDFKLIVKKLGFSQMRLSFCERSSTWESKNRFPGETILHRITHDFGFKKTMTLELTASSAVMSKEVFELLSELAAEAWHKAFSRWQTLNKDSVASDLSELAADSKGDLQKASNATLGGVKNENSSHTLESVQRL